MRPRFLLAKRLRPLFLFALVAATLGVYFQNCSKVKFQESSELESNVNSGNEIAGSQANFRLQTIMPSYNQVASQGNVKVLLVIDNSPTMGNSQTNLNKNLNSLLGQIQNYSTEVKVVSTTLFDTSTNGQGSPAQPALLRSWSLSSIILEGRSGTSRTISLSDNPNNLVYKFDKTMNQTQKDAVINSIRSRVSELGIKGIDMESQFAAVATQLDVGISTFFKKGDKALVYILTDEDDSGTLSSLKEPKYDLIEWAPITTVSPGLTFFYNGYTTSGGQCNRYNEAGVFIRTDIMMPMNFVNQTDCQSFQASSNSGNCYGWQACNASEIYYDGSFDLQGKAIADRCQELKTTYAAIYPITRCTSRDYIVNTSIQGQSARSYLLGLTKENVESDPNFEDLVLKLIKDRIQLLFGSKYLIGVSTNLPVQSCPLKIGQSNDTFFTKKLSKHIPATNLLVTSICDANADDSALKKIASEFESIMNNDYLISLASYESIAEVIATVGDKRIQLVENIDYTIVSGTFKILNASIQNFEKIEVRIRIAQ